MKVVYHKEGMNAEAEGAAAHGLLKAAMLVSPQVIEMDHFWFEPPDGL